MTEIHRSGPGPVTVSDDAVAQYAEGDVQRDGRDGTPLGTDKQMITKRDQTRSRVQIPLQGADDRRMQGQQPLGTGLDRRNEQCGGDGIEIPQAKPEKLAASQSGGIKQSNDRLVGEGSKWARCMAAWQVSGSVHE